MFPHPCPGVRAFDASRVHAPVWESNFSRFYTFTFFTLFQ